MSEIPAAELGATQGGGLPLLFAFLPGFFLFSALCFLQTLTRTPPARLFAESSAMAKGIAVMFAQNKSRRHGQDRSLKRCSVPDGGGGVSPSGSAMLGRGAGGHFIMRVSSSFISNTNTQAAAGITYTVTLALGA